MTHRRKRAPAPSGDARRAWAPDLTREELRRQAAQGVPEVLRPEAVRAALERRPRRAS